MATNSVFKILKECGSTNQVQSPLKKNPKRNSAVTFTDEFVKAEILILRTMAAP
jgi:hypothetical protein